MEQTQKRGVRKDSKLLVFFFLFIVLGFFVYTSYIYNYNHREWILNSGEVSDNLSLSIDPRTGKTDSWMKNMDDGTSYQGIIYDVTVKNLGTQTISNWFLHIDVLQDCFLNNAWCGTLTIHQFINGEERIQNLDLRNYELEDIELEYLTDATDLMIPLHKGDYLEYNPDQVTDEYPILSGKNEINQVVFGLIFYTFPNQALNFPQFCVNYNLEMNYTHTTAFYCLMCCCFVWIVILIVSLSVEWNMKKAHERFNLDERIIHQSIGVFTHFFEAKDIYTTGHSQRVAEYSKKIAEKLNFSEDECRNIYYIALMHDCGKCYIPDEILKKPGKLSAEEYEIIKSHTIKGAEMLENFTSIDHIRDGVLYHHERYDGHGYPEGLAGEQIPFIARIICVADSFDAMNSRRCYRDRLSVDYILSELKNGSGKQFDPEVVTVFLGLINDGDIEFELNDKV